MTPHEIQKAIRELTDEIGPKCDLSIYISASRYNDNPITVHCHPRGWFDGAPHIYLDADDWQEALHLTRARWAEIAEDTAKEVVRQMALAIIRITADVGECTNAALRADKFTNEDIEQYGADACRMADEMASNGPFRITELAGANAA